MTSTTSTSLELVPALRQVRCVHATGVMTALVAWTLAATMLLLRRAGLEFPPADFWPPAGLCAALLGMALYYQRRGADNFVLCLTSLVALVSFSSIFSVMIYALAVSDRPLADPWLLRFDAALGISAGELAIWSTQHPRLDRVLQAVYFSAIPQTIVLIICLGFANRQRALQDFLVRFMVCGLLTALAFALFPAIGTCGQPEVAIPSFCEAFITDLMALRERTLVTVSWRTAEGLVTFPSFHTVWAILLILAFRGVRPLAVPALVLNLAMIFSTLTTGMHYAADLAGGLLVCLLGIPLANLLLRRPTTTANTTAPTGG